MKRHYITRLEKHLEQIVEGTFASLFGNKIRNQDIALKLARAMQSGLKSTQDDVSRLIAPDQYTISVQPAIHTRISEQSPNLAQALAAHLHSLAAQSGYHLNQTIQVTFVANPALSAGEVVILATHKAQTHQTTMGMDPIAPAQVERPHNARLVINQQRTTALENDVINIGRHHENDIIIDDPSVSRFHLQLRLRFGTFILFNLKTPIQTTVNHIPVEQQVLKTGDIVRIGQTEMTYLDDSTNRVMEQTRPFTPDNF